ncbi:zinc finger protein 44 [Stegastes partitus]|uniref:Zinc finger protein 44-like n=1 Tax=Stegastes partitus TaxID=144197 RepID=A0A3B5AGA1_9TELE|nr:PREDICTED: zinc finger protein 44-like [Stegastes partitus]XP_008283260.1 PREDICTED: zinc finger protein 44-like [Stegastes partitus]
MSEDSSSEEEWCVSTKRQMSNAHPKTKCWECGKQISNLTSLISHYQSHNIKATCHICKVTFRRLTSLSTHLDNAHSPPLCKKCHQSFSNVWELNKHAETRCTDSASFHEASSLIPGVKRKKRNSDNFFNEVTVHQNKNSVLRDSASEWRPDQRAEMKPKRPETSDNSVEYIVGEDDNDIDMESDHEKADDSTSSDSDDEDSKRSKRTDLCPGDFESDGGSSSTDDSSDSSNSPNSKTTPASSPNTKSSVCTVCGRGPFRSIKLHLLHCSGVRVKYQCFLCKKLFVTETALNEHLMPLYSCHICSQVFSHENLYFGHQCPKGNKSSLVLFCSESLPKACNICKSFFSSEKALLDHVTRVHTSVVSTKVRIITDPSVLANKKVTGGVHRTEAQSAICSPNIANQAINGKLHAGQANAGSTVVKSSPSSLLTSSQPGTHPVSMHTVSAAAPDKPRNHSAVNKPTNQPSSCLSATLVIPPTATDTTPDTAAASDSVSPPSPTILAMFENDSQDVALMKRMNTGWRSKAPYPCRQCGAILRQPSLIISHRYLHRGRRSHRCQCGRAFKHRLHLLRHCVQHAEAMNYICVSCGDTFTGAKLLAQHLKGKSLKKSRSGRMWKSKVKTKCRMPFTCDCGQLFFRPSAYIWHQLKNRTKSKQLKKPVK